MQIYYIPNPRLMSYQINEWLHQAIIISAVISCLEDCEAQSLYTAY